LRSKFSCYLVRDVVAARSYTAHIEHEGHKGLFVTNQKPLCSFVSFVVKFKLLIGNLHLVNENTVCSRGAVAIELHCIGELIIHCT
jgi:hypothetical protein